MKHEKYVSFCIFAKHILTVPLHINLLPTHFFTQIKKKVGERWKTWRHLNTLKDFTRTERKHSSFPDILLSEYWENFFS